MKARIEDGKIVKYNKIPNSFRANGKLILGGGSNLPSDKLQEYGFYDVVVPEYDSLIETIYNLHLVNDYPHMDETISVFTYDKKDKNITQTIAELKSDKIDVIKRNAHEELSITDWYVIRKLENDIDIPSDVSTQRAAIRGSIQTKENEINALDSKESVLRYNI